MNCLCTLKQDVNFSQADDMDEPIGTQSLEGLSQASCVPDFDPSQTNNDNDASDWWTPMTTVRKLRKGGSKQSNAPLTSAKWDRWTGGPSKKLQLSDSPMADDGSPQASLYYFTEESWDRFTKWSTNPTALRIGPSVFNLTFAQRIVCAGKWLGNEEMDAMMYIWREKTSLRRWNIDRVAFMNAMFCLQIEKEYEKCKDDKRGYVVPDLLLAYGRGELRSHGRTNRVWGVDVDRLYFLLFVNGNHWVAVCVNMIEKKVEVYDCNRGRNRQYVEKFACMIPRIVKAVDPPKSKLLLTSYSIVDMPMQTRLNKSCADCGAFALKHLECILLGLDLSLVEDGIMPGCRQKIAYDIWEAAHDPILIQLMAQHIPSDFESSTFYDLEED
uniref:Ubiquitin-like protease family profile domain-containing protein n=2 Tax=Brassica oleracea var. oleracea TaxID=109376 RepID=A0A0D3BFQ8_BRAOL